MRARAVVGALVAGALVIGCSGDDDADDPSEGAAADADGTDSSGAFVADLEDGSRLRIVLDVDATDPDVAPFEAYRTAMGAPAVTWIVGELDPPDDRDGTGRFVTFLEPGTDPLDDDPFDDTDGVTNAEFACSVLDDWAATSADPSATAQQQLALIEGPCGGQTLQVLAPAGETTRYVLVYEGELPAYDRMQVGLGNELEPE